MTFGKLTMPDGAVYEPAAEPAVTKETWDGETVEAAVIKSVDERRYTLSVGYPANSADIMKSRDGHIDFASEDEIEKAAWGYMASGAKVGVFHAERTEGAGETVESYIYRGPDWEAAEGLVVKSGDWLIGTIWSEPAWEAIKRGDIRGTSMQGSAKRRAPSPADVAKVKGAQRA